jgi:hypothetical protein
MRYRKSFQPWQCLHYNDWIEPDLSTWNHDHDAQ